MMQKPSAILFDWDNTLANSWPIIFRSLTQTFIAMGHEPWPLEDIKNGREGIHHAVRDSFPRIFGERWEDARQIYYDNFLKHHLEELNILDGADAMIKHLAGTDIYTAIVSNKTGPYLRKEVDHLGWTPYFSKIVGAMDAEKDKPHPDPIHLALEGSNIAPGKDVWMVGDSETDLECALNAGCTPVFFGDRELHQKFLDDNLAVIRFNDHHILLNQIKAF